MHWIIQRFRWVDRAFIKHIAIILYGRFFFFNGNTAPRQNSQFHAFRQSLHTGIMHSHKIFCSFLSGQQEKLPLIIKLDIFIARCYSINNRGLLPVCACRIFRIALGAILIIKRGSLPISACWFCRIALGAILFYFL